MKRLTVVIAAAGLLSGAVAAGCSRASSPSSADILARNAAARGGLEAWRKVQTMSWSGHVESAHAPAPSMPFELVQKRPNKTRLQLMAAGQRSLRIFDGTRGWKVRAGEGRPKAEPFTPEELRFAQGSHGLEGPLLALAGRSDDLVVLGAEEIGGRKAWHLGVRSPTGGEEVWVDAETWLEVRHDRLVAGPSGGARRVSVLYGDYRTVDGLQLPFLITTGSGQGETPDRMRLERVVVNPPLDDSAFGSPLPSGPADRARPAGAARAAYAAGPPSPAQQALARAVAAQRRRPPP